MMEFKDSFTNDKTPPPINIVEEVEALKKDTERLSELINTLAISLNVLAESLALLSQKNLELHEKVYKHEVQMIKLNEFYSDQNFNLFELNDWNKIFEFPPSADFKNQRIWITQKALQMLLYQILIHQEF